MARPVGADGARRAAGQSLAERARAHSEYDMDTIIAQQCWCQADSYQRAYLAGALGG